MMHRGAVVFFAFLLAAPVLADGAGDNLPDKVRRVPPPGVKIDDSERQQMETDVATLGRKIQTLKPQLASKPALLGFVPDVEIYHKAVEWALKYDEIFDVKEVAAAKKLLTQGMERAAQLEKGQTPWNTATGQVVRGYVSRSMAPCSPMASWCQRPTGRVNRSRIASTSGFTAAVRS